MNTHNRADQYEWINPIGGLGDMLMLSGVLKQVVERDPRRRFMLVRRSGYLQILKDHPALAGVGFPGPDVTVLGTDYWSQELLGHGRQRPMQILGRMYGISDPVEERFCVNEDDAPNAALDGVPWGERNVIIAPGSASPRKMWLHENWETLTASLRADGVFVLQLGGRDDRHVRGAYSLLGLTKPRQVFRLIRRAQVMVTVDCFFVHAAHHVLSPSVVLWGPTHPDTYGYPEQRHLFAGKVCHKPDGCIGPGKGDIYGRPCPEIGEHCVDMSAVAAVYGEICALLDEKNSQEALSI